MARILVIEDELKTAQTVALYLRHAGHEVDHVGDGLEGLQLFRGSQYDLVVLDLMLPGLDGLALCQRMRAELDVRVVMLTARATEVDRLRGFELGADDYVTKPFSPRELVARVAALLRRGPSASPRQRSLCWSRLRLEVESRRVLWSANPAVEIRLTSSEFDLLATFMARPGRVFSRLQLIERAFGDRFEGLERTVDAHVGNLRRKLEGVTGRQPIETVFGAGYRFAEEEE